MNHLSIKIVRDVIALAEVCYPVDGHPKVVSLSDAVDAALLQNPNENALYQKVSSLSSEQRAELQALMLIGRGASGENAGDWDILYNEALSLSAPESVDYVASKYPLAEYLKNGLTKLGL